MVTKNKDKKDFLIRQLKDSMAKAQGAINLIDNSPSHFARNKIFGLYQKLGYILQSVSGWEDWDSDENNKNI